MSDSRLPRSVDFLFSIVTWATRSEGCGGVPMLSSECSAALGMGLCIQALAVTPWLLTHTPISQVRLGNSAFSCLPLFSCPLLRSLQTFGLTGRSPSQNPGTVVGEVRCLPPVRKVSIFIFHISGVPSISAPVCFLLLHPFPNPTPPRPSSRYASSPVL